MTAAQIAPRTGFMFMLVVKAGPDRGASYQLLPPRVTIGRGADNQVVLKDPRVSRNAAVIELSMDQIVVQDVSSKPSLFVNDQVTRVAAIKGGDLIRLGDSELAFIVEAIPLAPDGQLAANPFTRANPSQGPVRPPGGSKSRAKAAEESAKKVRFYVIVAVIGGLLYWLLFSTPTEKVKEPGLKTAEEIEKDLMNSENRVKDIVKKRTFKSEEERTRYEEAQKHYLEGFRDYQKSQWARAMRSFETARAIDPENEMAKRYYKLAEKQRDEMIALMTLEGRRYKEKSMYARCSSAFDKVLEAIPNKDDVKYKQAESIKKECDLLVDERFQ